MSLVGFYGRRSRILEAFRYRPVYLNRYYATEKKKKTKKYSHTVILPSTKFPVWIKSKERLSLDEKIAKESGFDSLYQWQRANVDGPEFILHDGPPYANGAVHMGHAINRILKDITIRHHLLNGRKVHFKPGWDCHGLPIELKALAVEREKWFDMPATKIRDRARAFASAAIEEQKNTFRSWGLLADWDNECYYTFDKKYVQNQLRQFYKMYEKGYIYRDLKPVFWSPSSRTALAEAELEYNKEHISKAVTAKFRIEPSSIPNDLSIPAGSDLYALIWTTTPWTLPANQAVAFNDYLPYSLVRISDSKDVHIIASELITKFQELIKKPVDKICDISSEHLKSLRYEHPLEKSKSCPLVSATYIRGDTGTGLVHTAPAHGPDDFVTGLKNGLPLVCMVDEAGYFTQDAGELAGVSIDDATPTILQKLAERIVHVEDYTHSYPYDWRTKKPVIIRCSHQWFINTEILKEKAIKCLEHVTIEPQHHVNRLQSLLKARPFWCISRQRVWGVPIPVLYDPNTAEAIINEDLVENCCELVEKHGTDFWWQLPADKILPTNSGLPNSHALVKGKDIMDIWFDSGISWSSVLDGSQIADFYIEGLDQCSGWFQSSLLLSVGLRNTAPYKNIYVHGFAVDHNYRKMSKSLGNVIVPEDVIKGKDGKQPLGIDVLRWWIGRHAVIQNQVAVADETLNNCKEEVQKLRAVIRFLLCYTTDFVPDARLKNLSLLDRFMLHKLLEFHEEIQSCYDKLQYPLICNAINEFIIDRISPVYIHSVKDRLYCEAKNSDYRLSCQIVCFYILETILRALAPITPHFVEEVQAYHPAFLEKRTSYYQKKTFAPSLKWRDSEANHAVETALQLKTDLMTTLPPGLHTPELHLKVYAEKSRIEVLEMFEASELTNILQVAEISMIEDESIPGFKIEVEKCDFKPCERCRRHICKSEEDLCSRCVSVINGLVDSEVQSVKSC